MDAKTKHRNEHPTAEAWLLAAINALRPDFEAIGKPLPPVIHADWGFDGHGTKKTEVSGQFWEGTASTDGIPKIIIRSVTDDVTSIVEAVAHQCVHAAVGAQEGHGKGFREVALRIGLEPPMRTSKAGKRLRERLHVLAEDLGPFPNAKLNFDSQGPDGKEKVVADKPEKQEARMLKASCLVSDCGYAVRTTVLWLRVGLPLCPIHKEPMHPEKPLPVKEEAIPEEAASEPESPEPSEETNPC